MARLTILVAVTAFMVVLSNPLPAAPATACGSSAVSTVSLGTSDAPPASEAFMDEAVRDLERPSDWTTPWMPRTDRQCVTYCRPCGLDHRMCCTTICS